jgi:hypothetical protein
MLRVLQRRYFGAQAENIRALRVLKHSLSSARAIAVAKAAQGQIQGQAAYWCPSRENFEGSGWI